MTKILLILLTLILTLNLASALTINSVFADKISPGEQASLSIELENDLNENLEDISVSLSLTNLPFTPVGSSEYSIEELDEDDDETFIFKVKASNSIQPGDYTIPYVITYLADNEKKEKKGSIGITITGSAELSFTISAENPVINEKGKINLKIINKGFAEARFVSIKVSPSGFTLLSESEDYIGEIDSDDFETSTFDVVFKDKNPIFTGIMEYTDFNNNKVKKTINLPIKVYTEEEAITLGIKTKSNSVYYIIAIVAIIIIWILYRVIKKRSRIKRSMQNGG